MTKKLLIVAVIVIIGLFLLVSKESEKKETKTAIPATNKIQETITNDEKKNDIIITPISHATMVLEWEDKVVYTDPVGGAEAFQGKKQPDLVLLTDIHQDHLDDKTLNAVISEKTIIIAPQAVADTLPNNVKHNLIVLKNNETTNQATFNIKAIPMYNLPESDKAYHVKGRGNGYVIEKNNKRVYVSGDTADTPEMRGLENIDIAFVSMNLPYTMSVESAADGVLAFKPKQVYPYHYRGSDVDKFKELVNAKNKDIEVVQLNWYPQQ